MNNFDIYALPVGSAHVIANAIVYVAVAVCLSWNITTSFSLNFQTD